MAEHIARRMISLLRSACGTLTFALFMWIVRLVLSPDRQRTLALTIMKYAQHDPDGMTPEDYIKSVGTWRQIKTELGIVLKETVSGYIRKGHRVPNLDLFLLLKDARLAKCRLLDFMRPGRPLVLNLGSVS